MTWQLPIAAGLAVWSRTLASQPVVPTEQKGMDDSELAALLSSHEQRAIGYFESEIAAEQARAINYYYGIMDDLPALDGCSRVVDHSVAVMVDNALAAVLKPFVSADEVVSFQPRGPEDTAQAEQATEYVNYVIQCDNPGFLILHNWFKDALLTKIGVVKVWWEDASYAKESVIGADAMQLELLRNRPEYLDEQDNGDGSFAVKMQEQVEDGRVRIENIPPEEFLITPFARSIEEAPYCAHRPSNYTRSDLIEMGVDAKIAETLPAFAPGRQEEQRSSARYRDEDFDGTRESQSPDSSRDIIGVIDEFVRVDYDGDGISELRRVIRVQDTILFNEVVDDNAFALLCPCPMPHKVYGRSTADQAVEGQKVRTAILRQTLDNLYKSNNPRPIVGDGGLNESTMDDLGDSSPGAVIRSKNVDQIDWLTVPYTAGQSFNMLEYTAQGIEEQTGFQRKGNGFNAEALKKNSPDTATQAAIDENSRNERAEMVARIFAETGVKRLFKLILNLLVTNQPKERIVRLRNQWVPMDPSGWSPEMDVSISVGLGVGNKAEQIEQAGAVLETMERLGATQYRYLVGPEHVHAAVKRLYTATGIKNVDDFIADPKQAQPPPPQEDPEMAKAKAQVQIEQMKAQAKTQADQAKLQLDTAKATADVQLEREKATAAIQLEQAKAAAQAQLAQQKAEFEAQLAAAKMRFEQQMAEKQLAVDATIQGQRAENDRKAKMQKNRPGGKLDE